MSKDTDGVVIIRSDAVGTHAMDDRVVVEEPLEIRLNGESLGVTMRTPGDDLDLAAGFMLTEGWIESLSQIGTLAYCADEDNPDLRNIVDVRTLGPLPAKRIARSTWASSSCGLCGKATLDSIRQNSRPLATSIRLRRDMIFKLPDRLRQRQDNFNATGGIHAAGLFDVEGECIAVREDIGRHNAVDKVIGGGLRSDRLSDAAVLMVSGRLGFEIAQKGLMARIPVVASVSAPSSLAVELSRQFGVTAIGFLRGESMNIYTHAERIVEA